MEKTNQNLASFIEENKERNISEETHTGYFVDKNVGYPALTGFNRNHLRSEVRDGLYQQSNQLKERLSQAIEDAGDIDERAREALLQNQTLIQRFFPTQEDRIVAEMKGKVFSSALDAYKKVYELCSEFQIEVLRERCNATLAAMRGVYRSELSQFLTYQFQKLQRCIAARQDEFVRETERQYALMYSLKHVPSLQAQYARALDALAASYFDFLQMQVDNYESIMKEQITRFTRP